MLLVYLLYTSKSVIIKSDQFIEISTNHPKARFIKNSILALNNLNAVVLSLNLFNVSRDIIDLIAPKASLSFLSYSNSSYKL